MTVVDPREKTPATRGEVVTLRSPGSDQLRELNHYEREGAFWVPNRNGEDLDHLSFEVDDLHAPVDALHRAGAEVVVEPYEVAGWAEAYVKDPNGVWIEILQK
jgi:catechol 2,3-dioxygenase-like lactoylglutathione lyase family enzyme